MHMSVTVCVCVCVRVCVCACVCYMCVCVCLAIYRFILKIFSFPVHACSHGSHKLSVIKCVYYKQQQKIIKKPAQIGN